MSSRRLSTRTMFVLVSLATGILLFGSAILQRIVFKADQAASAIFISPATLTAKPGQEVTMKVKASFDRPIAVSAAQVVVDLGSNLDVVSARASVGWQTVYKVAADERLTWIFTPDATAGTVAELTAETTFGELVLRPKGEGVSTIKFDDTATKIMSLDATQTPSLYNAVASTQAGSLTASNSAAPIAITADNEEIVPEATDAGSFNSIDVLAGQTAADILIGTDELNIVSIDFGTSPSALVSTVRGLTATAHSVRRLSDLTPATRYYYRVRLEGTNGETVISRSRAFTTASAANQPLKITAFPRQAKTETTVYLSAPGSTAPKLSVSKGLATVTTPTGSNGLYQAVVTSKLPGRQVVTVGVTADQTLTTDLTFDPNLIAPTAVAAETKPLPFGAPAKALLGGLAVGLLILTLILVRLTKIK